MAGKGSTALDGVRLEVFHHLFAAAAEEMGAALMRSSFSPNIKERRDFSCAVFDAEGRTVAQAAHLPVHLGSAPLSLAAVRSALELGPGDVAVLNDPYEGGTHLPDITLVAPVFLEPDAARPHFYVLDRAHHADVGGGFPGSMAPALDVHGEGLRIPPVHLVRGGRRVSETWRLLLANMRVRREREGDLLAQLAACRVGQERIEALGREHGVEQLQQRGRDLMLWTERLLAAAVARLPRGAVDFEDGLETAGGARLRLRLDVGPSGLRFDFTGCDDAVAEPVNTVRAVVESAVFYALRLLLPEGTPANDGILRRVRIETRAGSLVDARYPAPVAAGNVETSQRLVDVILGALARLLPERIPAASAGTMSNLTFGGEGPGGPFAYYETNAGGAGGGPEGPGAHAVQTHMTNTRNTPVEALERTFPVQVLACTTRRGSGGAGAARGGDGVRRRLRFTREVRLGWVAERQREGPWGLAGGEAGRPGSARVREAGRTRDRRLPGRVALTLPAGSEVEVRTPGGGGHGRAAGGRRADSPSPA